MCYLKNKCHKDRKETNFKALQTSANYTEDQEQNGLSVFFKCVLGTQFGPLESEISGPYGPYQVPNIYLKKTGLLLIFKFLKDSLHRKVNTSKV